jgi:2-alkenal reductase
MPKRLIYVFVIVATAANLALWSVHNSYSASVPYRTSSPKNGVALSDEQLGVLAVRSVKPAVVDIVGSLKFTDIDASHDAIFGTGFIVSSDGYIVSNSHVVDDATAAFRVVLLDGKSLPARVVGVDKYSDIALLKVDGVNMATVRFGNSDSLETGQTVFAIGYALGKYQHTVTRGVVSGLERDVTLDATRPRYQHLIQTDAAINKGNSGGPLVNMSGEVIGMNTLVEEGSGLGFAIPDNYIKTTIEQLKSLGKTSRPYLGLSFQAVTPAVKAVYNLKVDKGAYVKEVLSGSAAAAAGLRGGDVILTFNGEVLSEMTELDKVLARYAPGTQVQLQINRGGVVMDVPLIVGEYK